LDAAVEAPRTEGATVLGIQGDIRDGAHREAACRQRSMSWEAPTSSLTMPPTGARSVH
jgi:hypothetical protein